MRMTRDAYAREVLKVVEAIHHGDKEVTCPRDECEEQLRVIVTSLRTGTAVTCPTHGLIFRE